MLLHLQSHHFYINYIEAKWHIYASESKAINGSDNDMYPVTCQAIIWTNVGLLPIGALGTNLSEILIEI